MSAVMAVMRKMVAVATHLIQTGEDYDASKVWVGTAGEKPRLLACSPHPDRVKLREAAPPGAAWEGRCAPSSPAGLLGGLTNSMASAFVFCNAWFCLARTQACCVSCLSIAFTPFPLLGNREKRCCVNGSPASSQNLQESLFSHKNLSREKTSFSRNCPKVSSLHLSYALANQIVQFELIDVKHGSPYHYANLEQENRSLEPYASTGASICPSRCSLDDARCMHT